MDPAPPPPPATPAPRVRRSWLLRFVVGIATLTTALLAALIVGAGIFVNSQVSVDMAMREIVARSDGRLEVEGATGSLWNGVKARHLRWRGPSSTATADDVEVTWTPYALLSRGLVVRTFAARHVDLEVVPSDSASATAPPVTLALPLEVTIEQVAIARFDWHVGANRGTIDGLAFAYRGGADEHRISALTLTVVQGTLRGDATIGANAPFPISGNLAFTGAPSLKDATASARVSGTLAALTVEGSAKVGAAQGTVRAALTPLGAIPLAELALDATGIDLAAFDPALPASRLGIVAQARPVAGGLEGHIDANNTLDGNLDEHRIPLRGLAAKFAWQKGELALDDMVAELTGSGHAKGHARIPLAGGGSEGIWALDVRDVDLHRLYAPMIATRLRGSINADLRPGRQRIVADVADRDIASGLGLQFTAVVADGRIDIERFRARAGTSEIAGKGSVAHGGTRAFSIDATASRFDPSRFGKFPAGTLDGTIKAAGAITPAWHVDAQVAIASGSKLEGVALSGTARGSVTRESIHDASIDLRIASARVQATGSAGTATDRMAVTIDAPRLAELVPLLPAAVPRTLAGALQVKANLAGLPPRGGIELDGKGTALKLGANASIGSVDLHVAIPPAAAPTTGIDFATRNVSMTANATQVVAPNGTFATARVSISGTLGEHKADIAFKGEDLDVAASAHGGLVNFGPDTTLASAAWSGTIDAFENRGLWPVRLAMPAKLAASRQRIGVGETRIDVADGSVQVTEFVWDEGRITTRGSFNAVPVASAAHLAGVTLPFGSTLTLGGAWALAATPRLNGTLEVRREKGDIFMQTEGTTSGSRVALGITALEVGARFTDDAVDGTATFRSMPSGSADAKLAIGVAPNGRPGRIGSDAPLMLTANADLATLQILQPWIGTTAVVDGRAHAEITARGTVARAPISGSVRLESLRIDAPQYGVHYTDGRLAAHLTDGRFVLDDMQLTAGTGKFTASGAMASMSGSDVVPSGRIAWQADNFRMFNRPDLHLVVDGEGTIALQGKKISLNGKLRVEEGRIVYVSDPSATLGDDVVVKGWTRSASPSMRAADVPLTVDLALDFGNKLTFASQGLDTGLQGSVRVTTGAGGFSARGTLAAVNGTYFAFGQKLIIDPGRLIFDGPLDNPGLDIVALRKNLAVEAGVAVTGTVKVPIVTLTSNPPVPDGEKLSWLVLGQGLDRTSSSTDLAALQAASAALFGHNSKPITATIAERIGLDDISFKSTTATSRSGTRTGGDVEGRVVSIGKRLSENFTLVYEQGLTVATNALRIEYSVSRSVTLRAEAGTVSGAGIYYRRSFE